MTYYLGITDTRWFRFLVRRDNEDVNFWKPGGGGNFRALTPGAPFLFKLKAPINKVGGVGFFSSFTRLPLSIAWDVFEERNGLASYADFRTTIANYRKRLNKPVAPNPTIGCIVLTDPIFFDEADWLEIPAGMRSQIVTGKVYDTGAAEGSAYWARVARLIARYRRAAPAPPAKDLFTAVALEPEAPRYGTPTLSPVRLGQGAFRVQVTDTYTRRCAISGEKTLPALEAAHVKPYASNGPHHIQNGLLLRADIHKLYDSGYLTVTPDYRVEVSGRIKTEFANGKDYYKFHGERLAVLPEVAAQRPGRQYLAWHNERVFG